MSRRINARVFSSHLYFSLFPFSKSNAGSPRALLESGSERWPTGYAGAIVRTGPIVGADRRAEPKGRRYLRVSAHFAAAAKSLKRCCAASPSACRMRARSMDSPFPIFPFVESFVADFWFKR